MTSRSPQPPRPASELFEESLGLSPKQQLTLEAIQSFPQGARVSDLAEKLGMHANTVRGHLDELIAKGAVSSAPESTGGRGRPSLVFFTRVPDNRALASEYSALINILSNTLFGASDDPHAHDAARRLGTAWAAEMAATGRSSSAQSLKELYGLLRDMGFDPSAPTAADLPDGEPDESTSTICLHACPFVGRDGTKPSPFVCSMHEGFLNESTRSALELKITPYSGDGTCRVDARRPADEI
ncbi:helix-turn-helix transcriptional regulator [Corynebacterium tapiri]|uniref:Helix-turn-helix domain-containing protein n=1 Tax=Corynebacterium tapiri TaxID=1448266 RepID=A0A5C4U6W9_9CORY|nr:helix-turn-helix domain-containing protein [Corynebacterium tapiri]TNL99717.1 helix-turn-helix domain-containing protein [Corynebacterium tapiri]